MTSIKQKPNIVHFAVILAIFADLMFPKATAADSLVPSFTAMAGEPAMEAALEADPAYLPRASDRKPQRVIYVTVTAYSSTPDQTDNSPFVTANGTWVHDGTLAANFLRFGTKVRLPDFSGDKVYVVEDRMNQRYSYRADIWMETREAAKQFGVKTLKMEIF
ncbi:3D domain-containing protein [Candidatus Falkowbacteria bacterium]|nr:3D domain-containing protein [Candidatus Falkowbacteria bacterium]